MHRSQNSRSMALSRPATFSTWAVLTEKPRWLVIWGTSGILTNLHLSRVIAKPRKKHKMGPVKGGGHRGRGILFYNFHKNWVWTSELRPGTEKSDSS